VKVLAENLFEASLVVIANGHEGTLDRRNHLLCFSVQSNSFSRFGGVKHQNRRRGA